MTKCSVYAPAFVAGSTRPIAELASMGGRGERANSFSRLGGYWFSGANAFPASRAFAFRGRQSLQILTLAIRAAPVRGGVWERGEGNPLRDPCPAGAREWDGSGVPPLGVRARCWN